MVEIQGVIIFCDDVRDEVSGKATIIGTYGGVLLTTEKAGAVDLVGVFFGRIRGAESVRLKLTVEMLNHSTGVPPFVVEQDFEDQSGQDFDEWTLRVNLKMAGMPFEDGSIVRMTCEGPDFQTVGSMKFGIAPADRLET